MSYVSKITLSLSVISTCGIVYFVHYMQQSEREKLRDGVIKDIERQRLRKLENINLLDKQDLEKNTLKISQKN